MKVFLYRSEEVPIKLVKDVFAILVSVEGVDPYVNRYSPYIGRS